MKKQVLIVDDAIPILQVMSYAIDQLYPNQFEITTTTDTDEAQRLLESVDFDIVFCDVILFHRSGFDVVQRAFKDKPPHAFIVMMSSAPSVVYKEEIAQLQKTIGKGNFCFIEKPLTLSKLIDCVTLVFPELEPDKMNLRELCKLFNYD